MKRFQNLMQQKWFSYMIAACGAVFFLWFLMNLGGFFAGISSLLHYVKPIIYALVIAYITNPLMMFFEKKVFAKVQKPSIRRGMSVLFAALVIVLTIILLLLLLIPQILESIVTLFANLNVYVSNLQTLLNSIYERVSDFNFDLSRIMESVTNDLADILRALPGRMGDLVNASYSFGTGVFNFGISCILAVYFLSDKERLASGFKRLMRALMPEKRYRSSADFWYHCNEILLQYIGGDLLDGLIVGAANWIFMTILQMPYAVLISVIVGVTNLAPTFGPIIGGALGAFILVLVNPWHALWFLLFTFILQTLDGYVIKPKLFGSTLGVSSVWILVSLIVGGRMFGIMGVLLAIPFAAIMDYVYIDLVIRRLEARRMQIDTIKRSEGEDRI